MKNLITSFVFFMLMNIASAGTVIFKCTLSDGTPVSNLEIDIENQKIKWGFYIYKIRGMTDQYISAYQSDQLTTSVGGEVFVFNRITGFYQRATVFIGYSSPEDFGKVQGKLTSAVYSGRCNKPLL
jgi:hypothetical protein